MSKLILENLLGSRVRVKLLKLFFRQYPAHFTLAELVRRVQEPSFIVRRELTSLQDINLVRCQKVGSAKASERERFGLEPEFDFFDEMSRLMLKASPTEQERLTKRIGALGRIKLAVISGIFLGSQDEQAVYEPPADLFLVADDLDRRKLSALLKSLEAEMGGDVRFAVMDVREFHERYEYFDRFVRVLLEGPHRKLIDKMELEIR